MKGLLLASALCTLWSLSAEAAPKKRPTGVTKPKPAPPAVVEPPPPAEVTPPQPSTPGVEATTAPAQPAPTTPASATTSTGSSAPATATGGTKEEVITDFDEEEKKLDQRIQAPPQPTMPPTNGSGGPPGRPRGGGGGGDVGYKLIVDLLLGWNVGSQQISFYPNHTLVILMLNITEKLSLQLNIAPDPAFYELAFALTKNFTIRAGKILVPFGTNNFHHIIGGRVDQQSRFLPETWGDYGLAVNHLLVDSRYVSVEYDAYVVNGFGGSTAPVISAGTVTDNNFGKGIGGRVVTTLPKGIRLIGSVYHSLWNVDNTRGALYYAAGFAMPVGAIGVPVLDRIGLRAEWSRGELQALDGNVQQGITPYAVAKAGFFAELTVRLADAVALRVRAGFLNPDNTVTDVNDIAVLEPALVIGSPKLAIIAAYQFTKASDRAYSPTLPNDFAYAKVFLQY